MKLVFLFTFLSLPLWAQDYTLFQAENDHFQDYTREELMQRLGPSSELLPYYECNGINENDLFFKAVRENEKKDSLKIQFYKEEEQIFYREGEFYNLDGSIRRNFSNAFVSYVKDALKKIEKIPEGAELLRNLEKSHFPLTIVFGNNAFNPRDDEGRSYRGIYRANVLSIFAHGRMTNENIPFNDIGAGGTIGWNPKTEGLPPHVALIHEMYHAFDSIRGLLDMRFVKGEKYEFTLLSEYRAVYMENVARKAVGVPYRTHYGQSNEGPGVLDEHGEPRRMPTPCLK